MARRKQYVFADGSGGLPTIVADGSYPAVSATNPTGGLQYEGGNAELLLYGTFGGGTAKLQILAPDGTTKLDMMSDAGAAITYAAAGATGFRAAAGVLFLTVTGSTTPALKAAAVGIPTNN